MSEKFLRTRKTNLVLFGGRMYSGKTVSSLFVYHKLSVYGLPMIKTSLATPIKKMAVEQFGWDGVKDEKGRRLLQVLGTDAGRAYNENIWVDKLLDKVTSDLEPPSFVFVDDWRFPNERDFFLDNPMFDVTTVYLRRPGFDVEVVAESSLTGHQSESSLPMISDEDDSRYTFSVLNDGTIEDLYGKLERVSAYLREKIIED